MADLHVVEDLGDAQAGGAEQPGRREGAEEQHRARAELELALGGDDLADVRRVVGAAVSSMLWRIASSSMPICSMSASVRWAIGFWACFWIVVIETPSEWGQRTVPCGSVVEVAGAGGGVDAGLHLDAPVSPGMAVVMAPLRRSRTEPSFSGRTQPMQMPMRQPLGIRTPASSAASRIGVAPSGSTSVPDFGEGDACRPRRAPTRAVRNCSVTSSRPGRLVVGRERVEQPGRAARQGAALGRSGTSVAEVVDVEDAVHVVVPRDQADRAGVGERVQVAAEDRVAARWARRGRRRCRGPCCGRAQHAGVGAREQVAQHADDRRDAGAGGDEEQPVVVGLRARTRRRPARGGRACPGGPRGRGGC